jgi:hypothetical protein
VIERRVPAAVFDRQLSAFRQQVRRDGDGVDQLSGNPEFFSLLCQLDPTL